MIWSALCWFFFLGGGGLGTYRRRRSGWQIAPPETGPPRQSSGPCRPSLYHGEDDLTGGHLILLPVGIRDVRCDIFVDGPVPGLVGVDRGRTKREGVGPYERERERKKGGATTHAHRTTPLQDLFHTGDLVLKATPTSHGPPAKVVVEPRVVPACVEPGERARRGCSAHVLGDDSDMGAARVAREMPCDRCTHDAGSDDDNVWLGLKFGPHACILTAMRYSRYLQ